MHLIKFRNFITIHTPSHPFTNPFVHPSLTNQLHAFPCVRPPYHLYIPSPIFLSTLISIHPLPSTLYLISHQSFQPLPHITFLSSPPPRFSAAVLEIAWSITCSLTNVPRSRKSYLVRIRTTPLQRSVGFPVTCRALGL